MGWWLIDMSEDDSRDDMIFYKMIGWGVELMMVGCVDDEVDDWVGWWHNMLGMIVGWWD